MTIFEIIKFWWRVKKYNRRLIKQAKTADKTPYETTKEDVDKWIEKNPFGITRESLDRRRSQTVVEYKAVHIFKDLP